MSIQDAAQVLTNFFERLEFNATWSSTGQSPFRFRADLPRFDSQAAIEAMKKTFLALNRFEPPENKGGWTLLMGNKCVEVQIANSVSLVRIGRTVFCAMHSLDQAAMGNAAKKAVELMKKNPIFDRDFNFSVDWKSEVFKIAGEIKGRFEEGYTPEKTISVIKRELKRILGVEVDCAISHNNRNNPVSIFVKITSLDSIRTLAI